MTAQLLRPGFLVQIHTSVRGGFKRQSIDLAAPPPQEEGAKKRRWETTETIDDAADFELAKQARSQARGKIQNVCIATPFGSMCPLSKEDLLDAAIAEASRMADTYNRREESRSRIGIWVAKGRVADNDTQAAAGMANKLRELLDEMNDGVARLDAEAIRKAANEAREINRMLDPDQASKVSEAIEAVRKAARIIVKNASETADVAAAALQEVSLAALDQARMAFLDLEAPMVVEALPHVQEQRFDALDLGEGSSQEEGALPGLEVPAPTPPTSLDVEPQAPSPPTPAEPGAVIREPNAGDGSPSAMAASTAGTAALEV